MYHMLKHAHQFKGRPRASAGGFFFTMQNEKKRIISFFFPVGCDRLQGFRIYL